MKRSFNRHELRRSVASRRAAAQARAGKVKYALAAWLLGLPLPIILLALVFRGCDF